MSLPRFLVLKSVYNNKYLRYIYEDGEDIKGSLRFSGDEVVSPYSKYQLEKEKNGKLVHIRCCYNNKYWVRQSVNSLWVVAGADKPEEDRSKWSCTLFEPAYIDSAGAGVGADSTVRFRHIQLGRYVSLWRPQPLTTFSLYLGSKSPDIDSCHVYEIIDWESLLVLPKHITFKGDNGMYLSAVNDSILQFTSSDSGDPGVGYEIFTVGDGSVRIKSDYNGKFWTAESFSWITALSDDTTNNNPHTLFWPVKVDNNVIALRNLGNKKFCRRITDGKTNSLSPNVSTISKEARLEVEEVVMTRDIYDVNFRLMDARIYNQNIITMATEDATNWTSTPNNMAIKLSYTETKTSTWNSSLSLKLGAKCTFEASIPFIVEGKIEISGEFTRTYQWGETIISTTVLEPTYTVVVPTMTCVKVSLVATKGSCDVPFSYTQRDVLTNGQYRTYNKDDGIYTGVNCYNFKYVVKPEEL